MEDYLEYGIAAEKLLEEISCLVKFKLNEALKLKGKEWRAAFKKYKNAKKAQDECVAIMKNHKGSGKELFEKIFDVYNSLTGKNIF